MLMYVGFAAAIAVILSVLSVVLRALSRVLLINLSLTCVAYKWRSKGRSLLA